MKDPEYEYLWRQAKLAQNYGKQTEYGIND